ncbi:transketolase [Okibacterium endophyticum]
MNDTTAATSPAVTAARLLALDAVENAGSGHPGTAIALAPVADLLFQKHIRHDPANPDWTGRDRFVLSCGHASILLYTQLFLTGYDVTLDDLKSFRALGSRTPGHPELGHTPGVETTTGPLGQGLATAVGMAMALKHQKARFDDGISDSPFGSRVWVIASDGDLQEGISYEAAALAGRHRLDNLVVIYDDNDIQIEGSTALTSSEDAAARFAAQGWHVDRVGLKNDGDVDVEALDAALSAPVHNKPRIVVLKSQIAWPAPHATNTAASHGAPLGVAEAEATRAELGSSREPFDLDPAALDLSRRALARGSALRTAWADAYSAWEERNPRLARELEQERAGFVPASVDTVLPSFAPGQILATRDASGKAINAIAGVIPGLWGGSADLAEPNRTTIVGGGSFLPEETETSGRAGRNIHWGVREHAMAAAMNGIALMGGSRIFSGTFLVFSDYQRPAIRLASLMKLPVTYLWSHDSVALGSDGPTHQPIEHLASLRAIPGFTVIRPADAVETVAAWRASLDWRGPVGIVVARQPLPVGETAPDAVAAGVRRGAYIVHDCDDPQVVIVATGSEVSLAVAAARQAGELRVRVVSMPSREWFASQPDDYRESVIPSALTARVVVEAASSFGWAEIAGPEGVIVGINDFGMSAPADDALREKGMTVPAVLQAVRIAFSRTETARVS